MQLILDDSSISTSLADACALRDDALAESAIISVVRSVQEQEAAVRAQAILKQIIDGVEKARVKIKAPAWEFCVKVEATAREFVSEVKAEYERVGNVIGEFAMEQKVIAMRAEAERQSEIKRIEREKQESLLEAERARMAEVTAARKRDRDEIIKRQEDERLAEEFKQKEIAQQKIEALGPVVTAPKAKFQVVKDDWRWEVSNIQELLRCYPGCVKLEPSASEIKLTIQALARAGEPKMPGLRIWNHTSSTVRADKQKVINV